ncbi:MULTISPECIES: DUF998 domain-containing protein [Aurantimicrobium]|jgi:hypothetical membrane protein|uniref:DUF998 domain-containing protein n=1 Tax=Aurantimicrobium photophilum TaxID=1987356 RepID=A0A2Z3S4Q4_9MICO|nr:MULTISPECIES: DUF998 domain-containing protein [Aurantimicrobium]AWR22043.1 hypothetical protein AURMO_01456 [Aurantimicrobium photophilum]MDH6537248.1 putative membrane protein [Aurantimicrobium minutum]
MTQADIHPHQVSRLLLVLAVVGPVQSVLGWSLSAALWPGYDPIVQTISELASPESPVRYLQSSFFILGALIDIVVALRFTVLAKPARVLIFLGGLATIGLTIFPTPLVGVSEPHRVFATISFVIFSIWPVFGMRLGREWPPIVRPLASIVATLVLGAIAIGFLAIWTNPEIQTAGFWERAVTTSQAIYPALVIFLSWRFMKNQSRNSSLSNKS